MARNTRYENNTTAGRLRGGKLHPVMAHLIEPSEGGMLAQNVTLELDPIPGRLITPIMAEFIAVFVPVQALDALKDPEAATAGMTDVVREKMLSGTPMFPLETEGLLSKLMGVNPASYAGVKKVTEAYRLAHNSAVNFLRRQKYEKANILLHTNAAVTPALLSTTILERFNGVLDPDDHIDGTVSLTLPDIDLPVAGLAFNNTTASPAGTYHEADTTANDTLAGNYRPAHVELARVSGSGFPKVVAQLNEVSAGNVSLRDFYTAEKMDRLTREMRQIVTDNQEYGEEMVLRWAHGLSVDAGKMPFIIHQQERMFGRDIVDAMDSEGVADEVIRSDMALQMRFMVPIPKTELGGVIVTFVTMKPDENIKSLPHPIGSKPWGYARNHMAEELAIDPEPVTLRELNSDIASGDEAQVGFYTGHNQLLKAYMTYGYNRDVDTSTVEAKSSIWQLNIPLSVTMDNVVYPSSLPHYPFADQDADVCRYTVQSVATIKTPLFFGPSPVETLDVIDDEDLFEQEEA